MNIRRRSGNFQFEKDPSSKKMESIGKIHHKKLLLISFLQVNPRVKNVNIIYDLYYTVIKNRDNKEYLNEKIKIMIMIILILVIS